MNKKNIYIYKASFTFRTVGSSPPGQAVATVHILKIEANASILTGGASTLVDVLPALQPRPAWPTVTPVRVERVDASGTILTGNRLALVDTYE